MPREAIQPPAPSPADHDEERRRQWRDLQLDDARRMIHRYVVSDSELLSEATHKFVGEKAGPILYAMQQSGHDAFEKMSSVLTKALQFTPDEQAQLQERFARWRQLRDRFLVAMGYRDTTRLAGSDYRRAAAEMTAGARISESMQGLVAIGGMRPRPCPYGPTAIQRSAGSIEDREAAADRLAASMVGERR